MFPREEIKKVIVSQGVRIIGMHAFYDLPNLESADISHSVTDIRCRYLQIAQSWRKLK